MTKEEIKEMNSALDGLTGALDPAKMLDMFTGMQEGLDLAKQSLASSHQMNNTLIHINNNLLEMIKVLKQLT